MPARDPLPAPSGSDNRDPQRPRPTVMWLILAAFALTGVVLLYLVDRYPDALRANPMERPRLVYLLAWGAVLGASLIVQWRSRPGRAFRYIVIWLAIGALLMLGYNLFRGGAM